MTGDWLIRENAQALTPRIVAHFYPYGVLPVALCGRREAVLGHDRLSQALEAVLGSWVEPQKARQCGTCRRLAA